MYSLEPALAPDAGLFYPAERGCRVRHHTHIETEHPGFQRLDQPMAARQVFGVRVADQAVLCVVGDPDCLILIAERDNAQHGPEDLLAEDVAARAYARDHCRLIERAGPINGPSTGENLCAALGRITYQGIGLLDRVVIDQRTNLDTVLSAATDLERLHPLGDTCRELVGDCLVDNEPVGGRTGLADVAELGQHRTVNCRTKIS